MWREAWAHSQDYLSTLAHEEEWRAYTTTYSMSDLLFLKRREKKFLPYDYVDLISMGGAASSSLGTSHPSLILSVGALDLK